MRQRTDGCLVFLGRLDDQVKVHGLRIELGEIESVLAEHPSVAQAVVAVREDHAGDPQLVAYLTAGPGLPPPTPDALRRHLGSHLPVSMAPSRFVVLDAFPRNPNGKVDRLALPAPGDAAGGIDEDASARTLLEAVLAELFAEVLGIAAVGVHDGFFELGGSSMQAMRLLSRLGEALEVDVGVADIFQAPTVAALAELLRLAT